MPAFRKVVFSLLFLIAIFAVLFSNLWWHSQVEASEEIQQLQQEIDKLEELKQLSVNATTPLEKELAGLEARINSAKAGIAKAKTQAQELADSIEKREADLVYHYQLFANRVAESYKRERTFNPLALFFSSQNASQMTKNLAYQTSARAQDDRLIRSLSGEISQLNADKQQLESDQVRLAALSAQLDKQADFFKGEIAKAKNYQSELSGKIAALSAQQQSIISARSGSYITGVGSVPISGDYDSTIAGFRSNAPSGSFAVFTFGAHTHRNGMSQYGAKARAENGQNYKDILRAYYGKEPVEKDTGGDIKVSSGVGSINFEEKYLYGIAEMPDSWPKEALKAQAVAARTFAYTNYKSKDKEICITESCQVYSATKANDVPQAWREAVQETKGMILEGVSTQYSAITGGYLNTSGWDTTNGQGGGDWTTNAWESKANAPWFYKAWYREVKCSGSGRYSDNNNSCNRKPWLSQEEMSDILNAWLLLKNSQGIDTSRILPVTLNQCRIYKSNCSAITGDPYSMSELRSLVGNDAVNSVSGVVSRNNNSGQTTEVVFQTNKGEIKMSGADFKKVFNMRAPGYLAIHQGSYTFFNIEQK